MENLLQAFGWEEIHSKNEYMKSFIKDDKRLNWYTTTGTIQIQGKKNYQKIYRDIMTELQLEKIIK